jgi:hypothetical protein
MADTKGSTAIALIKKLLHKAAFTFCDPEKVFSCFYGGTYWSSGNWGDPDMTSQL